MGWTTRFPILFRHMRMRWNRGNAAIEFAFVAPAFFALMLGVLEIGTMTFSQFALQNSVTTAARLIRTGQAQAFVDGSAALKNAPKCQGGNDKNGYTTTASWFRGQICCNLFGLISDTQCNQTDTLYINVSSAADFAAAGNFSTAVQNVTNNYNPGASCDVVLIRATYAWKVWFPGLATLLNTNNANYLVNMQATNPGTHLLSATAAIRNEPYEDTVSGC